MAIPPVATHASRVLPPMLLRAGVTYACLQFLQSRTRNALILSIPNWLVVVLSIIAVPVITRVEAFIKEHKYERDAVLNGATTAYTIPLSAWEVVTELRKSFTTSATPIDIHAKWINTYGNTLRFPDLGSDVEIYTVEPSHIKAILATQFDKFDKGPKLQDILRSLLGDGIFNSDGDMWKFHRSMTRQFLTRDRISDFENFDAHAMALISLMKQRLSEGHPVNFLDAIGRFTLDSATVHLYGKDVRSLDAGLPYPDYNISGKTNPDSFETHASNRFVETFSKSQIALSMRLKVGSMWRLFEPWRDEVAESRNTLNEYIQPLIEEGIRRRDEKGIVDAEKEDETLLDHLLRDSRDRKVLQDELINMLVAGRDTTAGTLSWSVYMLAENPEMVKRLREEIISQIGLERAPTYADLRSMKYLRAFINETMRLFPAVPVNARLATEPTVLPGEAGVPPVFVPQGGMVAYSTFIMQRRTDLWGPDAHTFDPDRFLDYRLKKYLAPNPYIFVPFNAGPRICLGQQFAYNEMEFFLVRLLQNFSEVSVDWKTQPDSSKTAAGWIPTSEPMNIGYDVGLTLSIKGGLWINMKDASAA